MNPVRHGPREPVRLLAIIAIAGLALALGGCGGGVTPSRVARVVIRPGALLLTAEGETATLTAEVLDSSGASVDTEVAWASSDPTLVAVDATGQVTITGPLGSALVTATADGISSFPTTVIVAQPVSDAVLLHDDQVVTPPAAVSGSADPARLLVVVSGPDDLEPGDVIIGAEELGIGGVVESVTPTPSGYEVVYEPRPPQALFDELLIDVNVDLGSAPVVPVDELEGRVAVVPAPGGVSVATTRSDAPIDLKLCDGEKTFASFSGFSSTFENGLVYHVHFSDGVGDPVPTQLYVDGKLTQKISGGLSVKAGFSGTLTCKWDLFEVPVPVAGVLSLLARPVVPVGVGGSITGSITVAGVTLNVESTEGLELDAGFTYDPNAGLDLHHVVKPFHEGPKLALDVVTPAGFRIGLSGFFGLMSGVNVEFGGIEDVSILQAQAGFQQSFDLASPEAQADSDAYASAYDLSAVASVGIGTDLSKLLSWLDVEVSAQPVQVQYSKPLNKSPTGNFTASTTSASPGEQVHLHVKLDAENLTYLTHYNVSKIEIYRAFGSEDPTLFRTIELSQSNQSDFDTVWDTTGEEGGEYRFYAFVVDDLLAKVAEIPLEVDANSEVIVQLGGACVAELREVMYPASACSGTTTEDYQQGPEDNGIAIERHTAGSGLVWQQDSENPLMFNLTEATVTWTEEIEYTGSQPCFITSSGTGERVANTDPEAGAYVSGVIIVQEDGTYFGTGYVFIPDVADDGCYGGGQADVTVPLFTTGSTPTLQSDGNGGSYLVGSSDFTTPVGGVGTDTWSFHFPDLPPPH